MVYTLTLNPAIDYIARVGKLNLGKTNRTQEESVRPGGKGINVSIVLNRLGVESVAIGFIGGFTGVAIQEMVKKTGFSAQFISCEGNSRINVKLKAEEETEVNGVGLTIGEKEKILLKEKLSVLKEGDILVLAGSVPKGLDATIYAEIMHSLKGRGVTIVVDAAGELLKNALAERPFLIKPNAAELSEFFGVESVTEEETLYYAKELQRLGARNVIVSLGGNGALFVGEEGEVERVYPPKGKVVDTVGAGDSLIAGFLAGYLKTGSKREAFRLGVAAGSATAFSSWLAEKELILKLKKSFED